MLHSILDWFSGLPPAALYLALAFAAGIENVFPPLPSDTVVAFGSFIAARGQASPIGARQREQRPPATLPAASIRCLRQGTAQQPGGVASDEQAQRRLGDAGAGIRRDLERLVRPRASPGRPAGQPHQQRQGATRGRAWETRSP